MCSCHHTLAITGLPCETCVNAGGDALTTATPPGDVHDDQMFGIAASDPHDWSDLEVI